MFEMMLICSPDVHFFLFFFVIVILFFNIVHCLK